MLPVCHDIFSLLVLYVAKIVLLQGEGCPREDDSMFLASLLILDNLVNAQHIELTDTLAEQSPRWRCKVMSITIIFKCGTTTLIALTQPKY